MLATCTLTILAASPALQDCPQWDERFAAAGADSAVRCMTTVDLGAGPVLVAGGNFRRIGGRPVAGIASFDGVEWTPLATQIAGWPSNTGEIWDVEAFDDGSGMALYAAGRISSIDGMPAWNIVKWNGTSWSTLGTGGAYVIGTITDLQVYDDGSGPMLYAGGSFTIPGGVGSVQVARWTGSTWHSIGAISCDALGVYDDGQGPALYVGGVGTIASIGGGVYAQGIARYRAGVWSMVGPGLGGSVRTLATWNSPSGTVLVAGGQFGMNGNPAIRNVAAWNGTAWDDMGGGVTTTGWSTPVSAVVEHAGTLVATGDFTSAGGQNIQFCARFDGTTWSGFGPLYGPLGWTCLVHDDGNGAELYVGGNFGSGGGVLAERITRWNGSSFESLQPSQGASYLALVDDMTVHDDGTGPTLYASGKFTGLGGALAASIARWEGDHWSKLAGPALGYQGPCDLHTIVSYDDGSGAKLYAAGDFCWSFQFGFVQRWNSNAWEPLPGPPLLGEVFDLVPFDDGSGPALYAATGPSVMRWRNNVWTSVGPAFDGSILVLAVHDDGSGPALYAGGQFRHAGAAPADLVARWNGSAWSQIGGGITGPGGGTGFVGSLCEHDDGGGARLYAGGGFALAGGIAASNVAAWDGASWSALGAGLDSVPRSIASFDEGTGLGPVLVATGDFGNAGGAAASRIARWDGASWSEIGGGLSSFSGLAYGTVLAATEIGGARTLWIGGVFDRAGTSVSTRLARIEACELTGELFCFGDGSSGTCPCGNESASVDRAGCLNSLGTGGALRATGASSLASDGVVLEGSGMTNSAVLYFQAQNQHPGVHFGDGIKCTNGPFVRLGTKQNVGGASALPQIGQPSLSSLGHVQAAATRHYQARYRNPASFCTPDTFNYTSAVTIVWRP